MVKVHKKFKKLLAGVMAVMLLLSMTTIPASAGGITGNLEMETSAMNELSARAAINSYFSQRLSFLRGEIDNIDVINEGMMADEIAHKAHLEEENIVMQSSTVTITSVSCWDNMAIVVTIETISFEICGEEFSEAVEHEITLCDIEQMGIILQSDAYTENAIGFESASYLSEEQLAAAEAMLEAQAVSQGGSDDCIRFVAINEVGAIGSVEDSSGNTKYHTWYKQTMNINEDGNDWCAIFVTWCAAHANITESTIRYTANVPSMRWFFGNAGRFYNWTTEQNKKNNGQSYTSISAGDIVFMNGTASNPSHVGIVYSVYGDVISIVDGNWGNQVCYRVVPDSNTSIIGFGKPNYATLSHNPSSAWSYDAYSHWHECPNCFGQDSKANHNRTETVAGWSACTVCGYNGPVPEIMGGAVDHES